MKIETKARGKNNTTVDIDGIVTVNVSKSDLEYAFAGQQSLFQNIIEAKWKRIR